MERILHLAAVSRSLLGAGVLAAGLGGCQGKVTDADIRFAELTEVRALTLQQQRDPGGRIVAMIDARSSARFAAGHIPGARNLRLPDLPRRGRKDPELDSYRHIIVYGENPSTPSARGMTKRLMVFGYDGVRLFAGGMSQWQSAGYPVATPPAEAEPASP
ncbi:MAG: rhodanese-like domain-containing protein [Phycisphaerales bacterium JB039]